MSHTDNILNLTSQLLCQKHDVKVSTIFIRNDEYGKVAHPPHGQIDLWQRDYERCPSYAWAVSRTLGKNCSEVNMSKSACGCPVSSRASWNEAEAHCHFLRMQTTINSWSLGSSSTVASCADFSRDLYGEEDASTEGSPEGREGERKISSTVSRLSTCGRRAVWPMPVSFEDPASIASGELFHTSTHRFNMSISTPGVSEPRMKRWELVQKEICYQLTHSSNPHGTLECSNCAYVKMMRVRLKATYNIIHISTSNRSI